MRILQIMTSKANGGAETYACDVIAGLHKAGVDQCVVMHDDAGRFDELKSLGVRMAPSPLRIPVAPLQRRLISRLVSREKPTLIQTWMRRGASLAPKAECPIIGWFGGYYDPDHFQSCERLVGVTRDIVAHMVKNGVPADRAHYIPTFPTIEPMPPARREALNTPQDAKVLLTLSRLHEKKGLDVFLTAVKDLPGCVAWLAGDGPLQGQLEHLARALGIEDRVRFLGWRTDRAALLHAADVCVLPSRYEPFGTVILEAWASKTPLVACAAAGPAAHIEDGVTGMLVPIDDVDSLRAAINEVLRDDTLRHKMVSHGYDAYIKNFTPDAVVRRWIDFYGDVQAHHAGRGSLRDKAA